MFVVGSDFDSAGPILELAGTIGCIGDKGIFLQPLTQTAPVAPPLSNSYKTQHEDSASVNQCGSHLTYISRCLVLHCKRKMELIIHTVEEMSKFRPHKSSNDHFSASSTEEKSAK